VAAVTRSNAPVFWLLFGAGGMLAALLGTVLVFITGIAVPLGWLPHELMAYPRMLACAQRWTGEGGMLAIVALFAWHAAHRIFHSLHDLGMHTGMLAKALCYGGALLITLVGAASLASLG
jgi:fumarate reductase subunit D